MCDTFGKILDSGKHAIFGKNSDRENDEPQIVQFIPAIVHKEKNLKTTYLEIEQAKETAAIFISKPVWLWGAEMGVNEYGVCIGNEALYPNKYDNQAIGLLGMDLVRIGLERSKTAKEAVEIIIKFLEQYGQGGFCSLKNKDLYDNAFLIMDIYECYILETKNKHWLYKKVKRGCISNVFSVTKPDKFSDITNFKKVFERKGKHSGDYRIKLMKRTVKKIRNSQDAISILKLHNKKDKDNSIKSKSVCMHGDYTTTGSMVVELKDGKVPQIYFTATSHPCTSLFLPYSFGEQIVKPINKASEQDFSFWQTKGNNFITDHFAFQQELNDIQNRILNNNLSLKESLKLREQLFN